MFFFLAPKFVPGACGIEHCDCFILPPLLGLRLCGRFSLNCMWNFSVQFSLLINHFIFVYWMSWPDREYLSISGSKVGVDQKWVRGGGGVGGRNTWPIFGYRWATVVLKPWICLSQNVRSCKMYYRGVCFGELFARWELTVCGLLLGKLNNTLFFKFC